MVFSLIFFHHLGTIRFENNIYNDMDGFTYGNL